MFAVERRSQVVSVNEIARMPATPSCPPWCIDECVPDSNGEVCHSTDLDAAVVVVEANRQEVGVALSRFDGRNSPGATHVDILFSHDGSIWDDSVSLTPEAARRYASLLVAFAAAAEGSRS
jgi:hypothetical protein